jgi:hypothetical protein
MSSHQLVSRVAAIGLGLLASAALSTSASAGVIYQSATYTGVDTGEYILTENDTIGAVFTIEKATQITAIGAQFGGFPSGAIFGAILPVASPTSFPAGSSDDLAAISLAHVVFSVPQATAIDLSEPLAVTLAPGSYAVVFGSGQFGATGFAGLGSENDPVGSPTLIRSFFSTDWDSFDDTGVRLVVQGFAVPEPATWAMMIGGFAGVGAAMRRQRKAATVQA